MESNSARDCVERSGGRYSGEGKVNGGGWYEPKLKGVGSGIANEGG